MAVVAVIAALVVVAVMWGPWRRTGTVSSRSSAPATSAPAAGQPLASPATTVATAVGSLLDDSASSRRLLSDALNDVRACRGSPAATAALTRVVIERRQQLARAQALDFGPLTSDGTVQQALVQAFQYSLAADEHFLAWARQSRGCVGSAPVTADYQAATRLSERATAAKQAFLAKWNPLAAVASLPAHTRF